MQELTEREQKLLEFIKMLINLNTVDAIYNKHVEDMRLWKYETLKNAGFSIEWQDNMMDVLESEFGLNYKKVDKDLNVVKDDNQE